MCTEACFFFPGGQGMKSPRKYPVSLLLPCNQLHGKAANGVHVQSQTHGVKTARSERQQSQAAAQGVRL